MSTQLKPKDFVPAKKLSVMGYVPDGVIEKNKPLHICVYFERSYDVYNAGEKAWMVRTHAEEAIKTGAARRARVEDLSEAAIRDLHMAISGDGTVPIEVEAPAKPVAAPQFDNVAFKKEVKRAYDKYGSEFVKMVLEFYDIPTGRGRSAQQTSWGTVVLKELLKGWPEQPPMVPWFDESLMDAYQEQWDALAEHAKS